ncbi:hypothetical protein GCM10009809_42000 [Isoptericola hypogeus]|uniref:Uncharacterized protein n=1 Tax=Isoptericola hypogeus TaxID=300179 RepID=A0ABP4W154_9MICO
MVEKAATEGAALLYADHPDYDDARGAPDTPRLDPGHQIRNIGGGAVCQQRGPHTHRVQGPSS